MEKIKEKKTVIVRDKKYDINDPAICLDYITNEYFLTNTKCGIIISVHLHPTNGCLEIVDTEPHYIDDTKYHDYMKEGKIIELRTVRGNYTCPKDILITGNGKIHQSINEEEPFVYYDDYLNVRRNKAEKFRPFDNIIKAFTDLDNPNLSDEDKKIIIKRDFDFGVRSNTFKIFEGLRNTFGVELETSSGRLTTKEAEGLNLKCEFDGSLRETPDQRREDVLGGEYITGVLKGDTGMFQLHAICNKLSEKCTINSKAGVHVHIGGINFTKENVVYLYILGCILQDEIYQMLPTSRRKNTYCRKIEELGLSINALKNAKTSIVYDILIDEYYNIIFKYVSHGKEPSKNLNSNFNHPMGSKCGYDKNTQRYCWLNFVTALFNTKGNKNAITLEFRSHSATLNYEKIKNWVKICFAFVNFAENFKTSIRNNIWIDKNNVEIPISLHSIIMASYPKTGKSLLNYVDNRKEKFFYDNGSIENEEYLNDKKGIKKLSLKEAVTCV